MADIFGKRPKILRSPTLKSKPGDNKPRLTNRSGTPITGFSRMKEKFNSEAKKAKEMTKELDDLVQSKTNLHGEVKIRSTELRQQMAYVMAELGRWREKAERAEKELEEARAILPSTPPVIPADAVATRKRLRGSPATPETQESQTGEVARAHKVAKTGEKTGGDKEWSKVVGRNNANKAKPDQTTKNQRKPKEKQKPEERKKPKELKKSKADALLVGVPDGKSHAEIIRQVRSDPNLKALGEKVVKIRRTQNGDMLFELQKDPATKSATFKEALETALGPDTKVRALSHMVTVQIRHLDEITTVEEICVQLKEQFQLGEEITTPKIRLWNSFGGTQTAELRLQAEDAKKLLDRGKIKVGWTMNTIKVMEREKPEVRKCYRCMGFGHLAKDCKGEDRSKCCRNCGQEDHRAKACKNEAKCMLCPEDNNKHETGGPKCPAYKAAANKK